VLDGEILEELNGSGLENRWLRLLNEGSCCTANVRGQQQLHHVEAIDAGGHGRS